MPLSSCFVAVTAAVVLSGPVAAVEIWAIHERPADPAGDMLVRFSTDDPTSVTTVGPTGQPKHAFAGLEWMPDGRLIGFANRRAVPGSFPGLFRFDPLTGAATLIGPTNLEEGQIIGDITIDPVYWEISGIAYTPGESDSAEFALGAQFNLDDGSAYVAGQMFVQGFENVSPGGHAALLDTDFLGLPCREYFVQQKLSNRMHVDPPGPLLLPLPESYDIETAGIQSMAIDWSRDNTWYFAARPADPQMPALLVEIDTISGAALSAAPIGDGLVRYEPAAIAIRPAQPPCAADVDGSGAVDIDDLVGVITAWGDCPGLVCVSCLPDVTFDCRVDVDDLVTVLLQWGPCAP